MVCASSGFGCTGSSRKLGCGLVMTVITGLPSANEFDNLGLKCPPTQLAHLTASRVDRCTGNANVRPTGDPNALNNPRLRGVPRHFHHPSDAECVLGREPRAEISRLRGGACACSGQARHYPKGG